MKPLVTYCDKDYIPGLKMMIKSFLQNNTWFNDTIYIFDWGFNTNQFVEIGKIYPNIVRLGVDFSSYYLDEKTMQKQYYAKNFLKFEIFKLGNIENISKIVVLDADLLITGNIKELFDCYNYGLYTDINQQTELESEVPRPDTGVMVMSNHFLTEDNYEFCMEEMRYLHERYINDKNPTRFSNEWVFHNCFKCDINALDPKYCQRSARNWPNALIIGASGFKPWMKNEKWESFRKRLPWNIEDDLKESILFRRVAEKMGVWCE
jgi:lipopolysaccharide biosynthesis glycosyltransferase